MHLDDCRSYADEIIFYQRARKQMLKTLPGAVRGVILIVPFKTWWMTASQPQGVVDIFKAAGIDKPDISILDDAFLQTFKDHPPENLQVKLLERLLADEIEYRQRTNLTRSRPSKPLLRKRFRTTTTA